MLDFDRLLTGAEVARWLGVTRQWLDTINTRADAPPCIRIGSRAIRYDPAAVRAWLPERHSCALPTAGR